MLQFVESHWVEVEIRRTKVRLQVREPNALEGARYFQAVSRSIDRKDEVDGLAGIIQIHLDLLVACVKASEGVEPAFPSEGTEAERRAWLYRIPWSDVSSVASEVATVGFPKTGAGSSGETSPG
jgi:hypothetical protein